MGDGPAGAGKSSIAQSIAELCYNGRIATSFFFSRTSPGRNDDRLLIATLTYHLTTSIPQMRLQIGRALDQDPLIFRRSLEAQFKLLILEPLAKLVVLQNVAGSQLEPILIIIDGLDECGESKSQRYILEVLSLAIKQSGCSIFFLVASRPEYDIRHAFNNRFLNFRTRRILLDDKYDPDTDIKVFLTSKFDDIKNIHPLGQQLTVPWPSDIDIDHLVKKSSGQFIYASTVMKFIESPRHPPTDRLKMVLGLKPPGKNLPFAQLDALYFYIFSSIDNIEAVTDVLVYLLLFHGGKEPRRPADVEAFLQLEDGELQLILADLHSIIYVPGLKQSSEDLHLFHASLGDFLLDRNRSGTFFMGNQHLQSRLTSYCIKIVASDLLHSTRRGRSEMLQASYMSLLEHWKQSLPTDDLLQDLYNFDLLDLSMSRRVTIL